MEAQPGAPRAGALARGHHAGRAGGSGGSLHQGPSHPAGVHAYLYTHTYTVDEPSLSIVDTLYHWAKKMHPHFRGVGLGQIINSSPFSPIEKLNPVPRLPSCVMAHVRSHLVVKCHDRYYYYLKCPGNYIHLCVYYTRITHLSLQHDLSEACAVLTSRLEEKPFLTDASSSMGDGKKDTEGTRW